MFKVVEDKPMSVDEVKEKLYELVKREFADSIVKPALTNTAFYPTDKVGTINELFHGYELFTESSA